MHKICHWCQRHILSSLSSCCLVVRDHWDQIWISSSNLFFFSFLWHHLCSDQFIVWCCPCIALPVFLFKSISHVFDMKHSGVQVIIYATINQYRRCWSVQWKVFCEEEDRPVFLFTEHLSLNRPAYSVLVDCCVYYDLDSTMFHVKYTWNWFYDLSVNCCN